MSLQLTDLPTGAIDQAEAVLLEMLKTEYPSMDLAPGRVLRDLLLRPAAMMYALNAANMDNLRKSMSILDIANDPSLADPAIVDSVLSNLMITRNEGGIATGSLTIILTSKVMTPISISTVFTSNGLTFTPTQAFTGVTTSAALTNASSRLISTRSDGYYEFTIDITATAAGSSYNLAAGSRFTTTGSINGMVDLVAQSDMTGGSDVETNSELVIKAQNGLSAHVLSGRAHVEALLKENFSTIQQCSITGFGDAEMERDRHNLFGVSYGGKADIWLQTATRPQQQVVNVTATMTDAAAKTFTATLTRDQFAGGYAVLAMYRYNASPFVLTGESTPTFLDSLPIVSQVKTLDISSTGEFVPSLFDVSEGSFSRYCAVTVTFTDTASTLSVGQTATYSAYVLYMPDIAAVQTFVNSRARRGPASDYLVRGAIPVMVSVGLKVVSESATTVDTNSIKSAIANAVNGMTFSVGKLPSSVIIDAAHSQLATGQYVKMPISLVGKAYLPDDTTKTIQGINELVLTDDDPAVSANTVRYFTSAYDINVAVVTA